MPQKIPFRVIHASSHDDNHQMSELNTHSPLTRGWQSAKYCPYPQDIMIQLDERSQTKKIQLLSHQSLIATRVEFFIGDVPEDQAVDVSNARFTRLGYVALSDNEQTSFKARELKSVHVSAVGVFLKLIVHKNHINEHNPFNQVGIIAINVIGDKMSSLQNPAPVSADGPEADAQNRPQGAGEYISPLDDLAFDMYQDPEVAQIIRRLEKKKQDAVMQERYDFAKRLKQGIVELQKVGVRLGRFEVEKRQAAEAEDYDQAKRIKLQMEEYRIAMYRQLYVHDLLELSGPSRYQAPELPLHSVENNDPFIIPPRDLVNKHDQQQQLATDGGITARSVVTQSYDEKPLPSLLHKKKPLSPEVADDQQGAPTQDVDSGAESSPRGTNDAGADGTGTEALAQLTEAELRAFSLAIEVFGLLLLQKAFSKSFHLKTDSIAEMLRAMNDFQGEKDDARSMFRAAVLLVSKHLKDKVHSIFKAAIDAQDFMLKKFHKQHRLTKSDITYLLENTLPEILYRCADTASGSRGDAKACLMSFCGDDSQYLQTLLPIVVKPFKLSAGPRQAQSRVEVLKEVYAKHKLDDSFGFSLKALMEFLNNGLNHTAGSVRSACEAIIIDLYKEHGLPVKTYLPPDDDKTRKNVLYRQLFEALDVIDGKPSRRDIEKQRAEEEAAKAAEVEALRRQINQLKALSNAAAAAGDGPGKGRANATKDKGGAGAKQTAKPAAPAPAAAPAQVPAAPAAAAAARAGAAPEKDQKKKLEPSKSVASLSTPAPYKNGGGTNKNAPVEEDAVSSITKFEKTCIFCNEHSDEFTEEGLDLHYWKSCPMLRRCVHCKQVVEISALAEHLLTECEAKSEYSKCLRCAEAVPIPDMDEHLRSKDCNPADPPMQHCPLCHQNVRQGEKEWLDHLTSESGCKHNPRRVALLNRRQAQAKQVTTKSKPKGGAVGTGGTSPPPTGQAQPAGGPSRAGGAGPAGGPTASKQQQR